MNARNKYFDVLRGFAILMVVAIHTYKPDITEWTGQVNLGMRQIFNCAVPLFFAMSGFFTYKKALENRQKALKFWKHQISKVYIPTILWSMPLFLLGICKGKGLCTSMINLLICGFSIYYFIAVTIQFYLLLPAFQKYKACSMGGVILSIAISMACIGIVTYFNIVLDLHLPLIVYAGCGLLWLMFYVVGCSLSSKSRLYSLKGVIVILALGFVLSYVESHYLLSRYSLGFGIKPSSFIFSLGMVLFLMSGKVEAFVMARQNSLFKVFEYIGNESFILYLTHCYVIGWILPHTGFLQDYWLTRWLVVVIISLLGIYLMHKLLPAKSKYYLGIYDSHH